MVLKMFMLKKSNSPLNFLVESVVDQHSLNFWLQKVNPLWSVDQALGKIVQKDNTAEEMVSLTIEVNRHFKMGQAGQHHPVMVDVQGARYERTYSLTQIDAQHVLLSVKKVEQGKVSNWLINQAQIGDVLEFGQPYGDMLLPKQNQPMILLAAGSGITPMYSLLTALTQSEQLRERKVHVMYWVKHYADFAFKSYFEQWAKQYPQFSYQVFYTQEENADARLNAAQVDVLTDIDQSIVYACGPSGFVQQAEQLFAQAQLFQSEAFSMTPVVNDDTGFVNVMLSKSNKVVAIPRGQSILVGLEHANVKPTYGCRMGVCHKCVCNKVQGSTQDMLNGQQNSEPSNPLKLCVSSAKTDLVIDL